MKTESRPAMVHPVLPPHLPAPGISPHQHPDDHRLPSLSNLHIPKEALRTGTSPCTPLLSSPSARGPHMRPESRCRDIFPRQAECPCWPSLCPRSPLRIIRAPPSLPSILHSMSPAQRDRPPPPAPAMSPSVTLSPARFRSLHCIITTWHRLSPPPLRTPAASPMPRTEPVT